MKRAVSLAVLFMAAVIAISVGFFWFSGTGFYHSMKDTVRWAGNKHHYKAEISKAPEGSEGIRTIEWDGWGMFAQDTMVYLVYDPGDKLAIAGTQLTYRGKSPYHPCRAWRIVHLEPRWYSVTTYTNTDWAMCWLDEQPARP